MSLIPGVSVEHKNNAVIFWMVNPQIEEQLWSVGIQFLEQHHVKTVQKTESLIETQWVKWSTEDEEYPSGSTLSIFKDKTG
ncbi:outer membrane protein assembly factor BamC [Vibrio sp. PP-XX7]